MSSRMLKFEMLFHLALLYSTVLLGIFIRESKSMPIICCTCIVINRLLYKSSIFNDYNFDALYYILLIISDTNVIITSLYAYNIIARILGVSEVGKNISYILIVASMIVICFRVALTEIVDMLHLYGMELAYDADSYIEYVDSQEVKPSWEIDLLCKVSIAIMVVTIVVILNVIHLIAHLYELSIIALIISSLLLVGKIVKEIKIDGTKEV